MTKEKKIYYLIYSLFVVFFLAIFIIAFHNYSEQKKIYTDQFNENQLLIIKQITKSMQEYIDSSKRAVETFSNSPSFKGDSKREKLRDILAFYSLKQDDISTLRIYDETGSLIFALPSKTYKPIMYQDFSEEHYFKGALKGKGVYVSSIHVDDVGERAVTLSAPIFSDSPKRDGVKRGEIAGAVAVTLKLSRMEEVYISSLSFKDEVYIWGIDNKSEIIFHTKKPLSVGQNVEKGFSYKADSSFFEVTILMLNKESGKYIFDYDGKKNCVVYSPVTLNPHYFWSIAITTPLDVVLKINRENFKNILVFVAVLLVLFFLSNVAINKVFRNFTEIKIEREMSEKKREAEKKYRVLFENSANIIFVVSKGQYKIESFNKSYEKEFKNESAPLLGASFLDMLDKENKKIFIDNFKKTLDGKSETYEINIKEKETGQEKAFSISNTLVLDEENVESVQCIGLDISAKRRLSDELIEMKNKLQAVFDGMHMGISLISNDYEILMVNKCQADWLGNPKEYFIGKKCYEAFRNIDTICEKCPAVKMLKDSRPNGTDVKIKGLDGKTKYYHLYTYPVHDANNETYGFIASVQDLTDVKFLETEVIAKEAELKVMDNISNSLNEQLKLDIILYNVLDTLLKVLNIPRGIVLINDEESKKETLMAKIGVTSEFINRLTALWGSEDIINEFMHEKTSVTIDNVSEHEKVSFDLKTLFQSEEIEVFTLIPIRVKDMIIGIVILLGSDKNQHVLKDLWLLDSIGREIGRAVEKNSLVETLKEYKKELVRAEDVSLEKERLEAANELAGATTHELNQPLTTIISYSEFLMSDTPEDSNTYQTLKVIKEEARRIEGMIKKIASVTKYETKKYIGDTKVISIENEDEETTAKIELSD
jgi:PAS domain S-box-containing protein